MVGRSKPALYSMFLLKAILAATLIMFGCMSMGELLYDENLFSGFLKRPSLWFGVFLETTIATIFMTAVGGLILYRFRYLSRNAFVRVAVVAWCLSGCALVALYSAFYWTRAWHLTVITPGFIFGWILPGLLFVTYLVFSSLEMRSKTSQQIG